MRTGRWRTREIGGAKAMALAAVFLFVLGINAGRRPPARGQDLEPGPFRISVDVALVVLHATVNDGQGGLVSNLEERDFAVYEDGVRQRVTLFRNEDIPVTVGLVVDHSTTMVPKLSEVKEAARAFVRRSNRNDEMFVVNFNELVLLGLPPAIRFTDDPAELDKAIMSMRTDGKTALYDAVAKGLEQLRFGRRDKKVLIVVSDGGDTASTLTLSGVMKLAAQSSAVIYAVGLFDASDPDRNPRVLKRLAGSTGGEAFFPEQISEVVSICERIALDIRHQYTLGYTPTNAARDGAHRHIRVIAHSKDNRKLSVRTRTGYVAARDTRAGGKDAQ